MDTSPQKERSFEPGYLRLHKSGELAGRIEAAREILTDCTLCPWHCHVNRLEGEKGVCQVGALPMVSSYGPHFGEERPLVGRHGSGTIFLSYCNLKCIFCQNYDISHLGEGREVAVEELGEMMLSLWRQGCHNINFVTPSHQAAQIIAALPHAIEGGLDVPLIYNCGGYEELATLRLLDGIFDIYMPDFKYGDSETALRLSGTPHYVETAREALKEMQRQMGDLVMDERGIAVRGILVRHLVLPAGLAGTREVMGFIAREISPDTYVNLMDQYRPCFQASDPPMNRRITPAEFKEAVTIAREEGIHRLDGISA
ncbi:radical SAM protein [Geobacter sp.]|uniref:radical SAM protein n=1 Tax=Geobacter sp. TaxID=46610 RepID=UPI002614052E|nr:radical SAM protein [Geobacter sp.]